MPSLMAKMPVRIETERCIHPLDVDNNSLGELQSVLAEYEFVTIRPMARRSAEPEIASYFEIILPRKTDPESMMQISEKVSKVADSVYFKPDVEAP